MTKILLCVAIDCCGGEKGNTTTGKEMLYSVI